MYLHIVFVLLYSACRSVSILSCVDVIQSFAYVSRVVISDVTKRRGVRAREKARGDTNGLSQIPSKKRKRRRNKTGTPDCGSLVVAYFRPVSSTDRLHRHSPLTGL